MKPWFPTPISYNSHRRNNAKKKHVKNIIVCHPKAWDDRANMCKALSGTCTKSMSSFSMAKRRPLQKSSGELENTSEFNFNQRLCTQRNKRVRERMLKPRSTTSITSKHTKDCGIMTGIISHSAAKESIRHISRDEDQEIGHSERKDDRITSTSGKSKENNWVCNKSISPFNLELVKHALATTNSPSTMPFQQNSSTTFQNVLTRKEHEDELKLKTFETNYDTLSSEYIPNSTENLFCDFSSWNCVVEKIKSYKEKLDEHQLDSESSCKNKCSILNHSEIEK